MDAFIPTVERLENLLRPLNGVAPTFILKCLSTIRKNRTVDPHEFTALALMTLRLKEPTYKENYTLPEAALTEFDGTYPQRNFQAIAQTLRSWAPARLVIPFPTFKVLSFQKTNQLRLLGIHTIFLSGDLLPGSKRTALSTALLGLRFTGWHSTRTMFTYDNFYNFNLGDISFGRIIGHHFNVLVKQQLRPGVASALHILLYNMHYASRNPLQIADWR